jgi:hypothetical protein
MRIQEGPAFSGLIIGMGLAFLINNQTGNLPLALFAGVGVGLADYFILAWVNNRKANRK